MAETPRRHPKEPLNIGSSAEILSRALARFNAGAFVEAEDICRQVVTQQPDNADAWHLRANAAWRSGGMEIAIRAISEAVTLDPKNESFARTMAQVFEDAGLATQAISAWQQVVTLNADDPTAHLHLAALLHERDEVPEALAHYQQVAVLCPDDAPMQYACATALAKTGRHEAAVTGFEAVLSIEPGHADAVYNLAVELHACSRLEDAIRQYFQALVLHPDWAQAHNNLSVALREARRTEEAIAHGEAAVAAQSEYPHAYNNLGLALLDAGRIEDAATQLERATAQSPDDVDIKNNLAVALDGCGRNAEAMQLIDSALRQAPDWPIGHQTRGNLLRRANRLDEAVVEYRIALVSQPLDFELYGNLGLALLNQGKPEDAVAIYEKALALNPDLPEIHTALGIAQLAGGDYENGWTNYEYRWECADFAPAKRRLPAPRWDGSDLAGRRILLFAEQGYGDTVQFCRYVSAVEEQAAGVVFECQPALARLAETLDDSVTVIPRGDPLPQFDVQAPLMSLPLLLNQSREPIAAKVPYLSAPEENRLRMSKLLENGTTLKVGIAWAGNAKRQDDVMRSCPPDRLRPLFEVAGAAFFSLQKDVEASRLPELVTVTDLGPELHDFADTAAAVAALDLVISVDTAVAHLAGALGRPVWVMLGYAADWRYQRDRADSPWYPTMRLFRQDQPGAWTTVVEQVAGKLSEFAAARSS